jgi:hypothetical protein
MFIYLYVCIYILHYIFVYMYKSIFFFFLLHGLSPRANYTDRATVASRRSVANLCG